MLSLVENLPLKKKLFFHVLIKILVSHNDFDQ